MRRDLVEAELFIIVRADPFGAVNCSFFQSRENIAAADLLRYYAQIRHNPAGESADPEFQPLEIVDRVDLLAEPYPHLAPGVAGHQSDDIELFVEVVQQVQAAAMNHPGLILPLVGTECDRRAKCEGGIFSEIII